MKTVYVITGLDLGWDCVCGVFTSMEAVADYFNEDLGGYTTTEIHERLSCYVVHRNTLED
jgi:hypothetical protein